MNTRAPAPLDSSDDLRSRILTIRGQKVILDADLAALYGVTTKNLNKAVKRNRRRFPSDFLFQLTKAEVDNLRFQIGASKPRGHGGRRYLPYAFTENGAIMAANVLNSPQAVRMSVFVVRALRRSLPRGHPLLRPSASLRGHASRRDHLRAVALRRANARTPLLQLPRTRC